jgi:DNA-binding MarR family transcriptional regulator
VHCQTLFNRGRLIGTTSLYTWEQAPSARPGSTGGMHLRKGLEFKKIMAKSAMKPIADAGDNIHGGAGLAVFDEVPGHLIRCARQIAVAIYVEELEPFKITSVQYAALVAIRANPGADQRTLVDLIAIDRSTIGTLLGRLEEAGLVTRTSPPENQRIKQVSLTQKGATLLEDSAGAINRVQQRLLEPLTSSEQAQLIALLSKLVRGNNDQSRVPLKERLPEDAKMSRRATD